MINNWLVAAKRGDIGELTSYLETGFDINAKDSVGFNGLMISVYDGNIKTINFFLANGALIVKKDNLLHIAQRHNDRNIMELLLRQSNGKLDLNDVDDRGNSLLILSVINNNQNLFDYYLEKNCKIKKLNDIGKSVFDYALVSENKYYFDKLMSLKAQKEKKQLSKLLEKKGCVQSKKNKL